MLNKYQVIIGNNLKKIAYVWSDTIFLSSLHNKQFMMESGTESLDMFSI